MLSWKIHTRITFAFEQCIKYNISSTFRLSPPVAKPKMYFFLKNCLGTSLPHHDLASPVETEHAAMAGLPTPSSRKISDFRKRQHTTVFFRSGEWKSIKTCNLRNEILFCFLFVEFKFFNSGGRARPMRIMLRKKSITCSSKTTLSWFVLRHITILTYCVCPTVQCFKIVIVPNEVYAEFLCVKN